MKINFTLFISFMLLTLTSCHRYYTSSSFDAKTAKHKTIAVLPPQMVFTGTQPRNMTPRQIEEQEEKESKQFQESLFNNILERNNSRKYEMFVSMQPYTNTLALLAENNISIRDSWSMGDKELAQLLGVDAVVRTTIKKDRYMSELASYSIEAGRRILVAVTKSPTPLPVYNKTNDIHATCSVVSSGEILWNDTYQRESDWSRPANDIIENITDKFAKHFPYKRKV